MVVVPLQEAAMPDVSAHRGGTQARPPALENFYYDRIYTLVRAADGNPRPTLDLHQNFTDAHQESTVECDGYHPGRQHSMRNTHFVSTDSPT
jgi:hypothetical protein